MTCVEIKLKKTHYFIDFQIRRKRFWISKNPKTLFFAESSLNVISTQVIPESDYNWIFRILTFRIVFYGFENLENHVCIIFLLNVICTRVIPESAKNLFFRFLTFIIVFFAFANLENIVCVVFQSNIVCMQMIPESENVIVFGFWRLKLFGCNIERDKVPF